LFFTAGGGEIFCFLPPEAAKFFVILTILTLLETSRRLVKLQAPESVDGGLIRPMSSPPI